MKFQIMNISKPINVAEEDKTARLCYRVLIITQFEQALVEKQMSESLTIL